MSYDILTFMGEEPKAKSLAVEKYLEKNCDSKLCKHCHTKFRKSCCKSATTGIVIKKILKEKEMFDIKSIFWGRARGIRERERDKELPSALLLLSSSGGKEGRGWQLHHQPPFCQGVRLSTSTQILVSLKYEDWRFWSCCKTDLW